MHKHAGTKPFDLKTFGRTPCGWPNVIRFSLVRLVVRHSLDSKRAKSSHPYEALFVGRRRSAVPPGTSAIKLLAITLAVSVAVTGAGIL